VNLGPLFKLIQNNIEKKFLPSDIFPEPYMSFTYHFIPCSYYLFIPLDFTRGYVMFIK
jgi:hypothetical protein